MKPHLIDLTKYHFRRESRGFVVYGTWMFHATPGERPEPALAIVPGARLVSHERTTPAVIPLRRAWLWSEEAGNIEGAMHRENNASGMLQNMDMPDSIITRAAFVSLVRDHLGDLQHIPPYSGERREVADAIRTDHDGRQHHAVITEAV